MSDYPMLISNKLHSFRNFTAQKYRKGKQGEIRGNESCPVPSLASY